MSAASGPVRRAAIEALRGRRRGRPFGRERDGLAVLDAAHDPTLGLDRSVCLRDVVAALRRLADAEGLVDWEWFAGEIEREFGGGK